MKVIRPGLWLAGALLSASAWALPTFEQVRAAHRPSHTALLDREGALLQQLRSNTRERRGEWVALDQISPALQQALLLSEDRRFYEHSGVDWQAVASAAWGQVWHQRTRGASTLTMQLAGLIDADLALGPGGRRWGQKLGQAVTAKRLENTWRKDQILEAYLNAVPFRGEMVGIDALSRNLFGKAAHGLNHQEAALTAALVRAPNAAAQRVAQRSCALLRILQSQQGAAAPDCTALAWLVESQLQRREWLPSSGIAPHAARRALAQAGATPPAAVRTTLWAPLQREAQAQLQRQLHELRAQRVRDGAVLVLDNASGEVLAWVGSSGPLSAAPEVDAVLARRQAGSTLKPFLYAQALAEKRLTAASLIEDAPTHIPTPAGLYIPQNYDRNFLGWVSARHALAASLNVPAVRTLAMVSPDGFHRQLQRLGLTLRESGDYFGLGLALGSAEVSLFQLTNAYRALANQGRFGDVRPLLPGRSAAAPTRQVLDAGASFIVADMLADANARASTFGSDSVLATRFWSAVKTGTSKDMRDNWAVGWSQRYTVGVWLGNAGGEPMGQVSGASGAAPVWAGLMAWLHQREPSHAPAAPPGVVRQAVRFEPALEPARDDWFLAGTQQAVFALASPAGQAGPMPRILSPSAGSIVALDPDIPPPNQRLALRSDAPGARWRIQGRWVGQGREAWWSPWPGRHRIELVDARGYVLDAVRIEVRGAGVKAAR